MNESCWISANIASNRTHIFSLTPTLMTDFVVSTPRKWVSLKQRHSKGIYKDLYWYCPRNVAPRWYSVTLIQLSMATAEQLRVLKTQTSVSYERSLGSLTTNPFEQQFSGLMKEHTGFNFSHPGKDGTEAVNNKAIMAKILERERLKKFQDSLRVIEISPCTAEGKSDVFEAMIKAASIFEEAGDLHKSIFYYSNGLRIAEGNGVASQKAQVKLSLGRVYTVLKSFTLAIRYFEDYIQLASELNDVQGIKEGANHLLQIYLVCADEAEKSGESVKSIQFYLKCIEAASIGDNDKIIALTGHKIGLLHFRMKQSLTALEYQMKYLAFCKMTDDKVGKCNAHTALAQIYESLGQVKDAVNQLESLLDTAKLMDRTTEARAYCRLGLIYARHSQVDYAVAYFERFYSTAWKMKDPKMLAIATINLGFTRCVLP
ncbi:hypothetical protein R1sor_000457 [Riccia sorocarpa]|uniref:Tetratricopeptide repeat protein 29 n=1 Tax=Riccia sorocarpa TaxID=122646 RepID=A0ABD3GWD7_9MARC